MARTLVVPLCVVLACARTGPAPALAPAASTVGAAPVRPGDVAAVRSASRAGAAADPLALDRVNRLRAYVRATWPALTRTVADLPRAAADPKALHPAAAPWPVYLPRDEDPARVAAALRRVLPEAALATIVLRPLPADQSAIDEHGILYLPRPYVVPGGRFNEMYGWDSYFILLGLLDDGAVGQARDLVDDFLYEVAHYGGVLNANRTYFLSRSQPPLLGEMVMALYRATGDRTLLVAARPALEATYRHWTVPPHLAVDGLSRYYDHGEGPAPEVLTGERDAAPGDPANPFTTARSAAAS